MARKYNVTVACISHIEVEADSPEAAREIADRLLDDAALDTMTAIMDASSGWEITDIGEG